MTSVNDVMEQLQIAYPLLLAEDWDNVGLLVGDRNREVSRVMTCLTLSYSTVDEAVAEKADLILSHHPFPFRSDKKWTTDTPNGTILQRLIRGEISVFSPHTAHDSAFWGINRQLADLFNLEEVRPLIPSRISAAEEMLSGLEYARAAQLHQEIESPLGTGRIGRLPVPLSLLEFSKRVGEKLNQSSLTYVGNPSQLVSKVAIACGAADDFVSAAADAGADLLLLGEARFHNALLAEELGLPLILPGHYATERFAMDSMAARVSALFPDLTVWGSRKEKDPIRYYHREC